MKLTNVLTLLTLGTMLYAIPTSQTNLLKQSEYIDSITKTNLKKTNALFDGVASSQEGFAYLAENAQDQHVIIKLKNPTYLRELKVFLDKQASCKNVIVRYSKDTFFWFDLDDVKTETTTDSQIFSINGDKVLANYVAFVLISNGQPMKIQEIELYPEMDIRLRARHIKDKWQCTDQECFNDIDTKIDTVKHFMYNEAGSAQKFTQLPPPVLDGEVLAVGGLKPGTQYEYKMNVMDYNGYTLNLDPRRFNTKSESLAAKKSTEGTFTTYYDGSKIPANENPLTDGKTDLKTGLAMSGSVKQADQYTIIDLGAIKDVSEVALLWRSLGYSKDYSIQVSTDKQNWQTVAKNQNADNGLTSRTAEGHPTKVLFTKFGKTKARYIKVLAAKDSAVYSKHGTSILELFEFKVF